MGPEPRSRADQGQPVANPQGEEPGARPGPKVKSFEIDKRLIVEAWEKVRANNGAPVSEAYFIAVQDASARRGLPDLAGRRYLLAGLLLRSEFGTAHSIAGLIPTPG